MSDINIEPIGFVLENEKTMEQIKIFGKNKAVIKIEPAYLDATYHMEAHSHFWVLSWMHMANRDLLRTSPRMIHNQDEEYGVFGLRAAGRPNPVGLSLVKLIHKDNDLITVEGLDLLEGTPIIDIKPYFEPDCIFSPRSPYIRPQQLDMRMRKMKNDALNHHQEECNSLCLAVRMAELAESRFLTLTNLELTIQVVGTGCLADAIMGMTRARFSNPKRFFFTETEKD